MRLLIAGDTHAFRSHLTYLFKVAAHRECSQIFVLGDMGYWPRTDNGVRFLKHVYSLVEETGIKLAWLDGNHEDHAALKQLCLDSSEDFIPVFVPGKGASDGFTYVRRGSRWEWGGVSFLALGGAYSVDRDQRTEGESFFYEEVIDDADVERAIKGGKVDVMLTHDVPTVPTILELLLLKKGRFYKLVEEAEHNREQLESVRAAVRPTVLFHGHYHIDYSQKADGTLFRVLDCHNETGFSWTVFDTEAWDEHNPYYL